MKQDNQDGALFTRRVVLLGTLQFAIFTVLAEKIYRLQVVELHAG